MNVASLRAGSYVGADCGKEGEAFDKEAHDGPPPTTPVYPHAVRLQRTD